MSTTVGQMKSIVTLLLGNTNLTDYINSGQDLILVAMNNARRSVERLHDFNYSRVTGTLSVASSGGDLTAIQVNSASVVLKRIYTVSLPVSAGDYIPVEFMTEKDFSDRLQRQVGRTPYDSSLTAADYGISSTAVVAYQRGQVLFLYPPSQITFPITARIDIVEFLPDYTADGNTDFLLTYGTDYIQWATIYELNKMVKAFVPRAETEIQSEEIAGNMQSAYQSLLAWDNSINNDGTEADTQTIIQPVPNPVK